ncbi:MAG TPA: galactose-1-phosphate uridylyltransferase, partial [Candidatus Flavonifractor merdipullorum]|nr:galactose-1-phosphate uridylyltransferase [Candidatus Flavonifractor merdipullorum]
MTVDNAIQALATYGLRKGLIQEADYTWAVNTLMDILRVEFYAPTEEAPEEIDLPAVLTFLMDDAHARGVLPEDSITYRDLFDTRLMGALTPRPTQVVEHFNSLYAQDPKAATDWF